MTNLPIPNRPGQATSRPAINEFTRRNGSLTTQQMEDHFNRMPMIGVNREYAKEIFRKFDIPGYSRGISEQEFHKGLDEMAKNTRDSIDLHTIEQIKRHFSL